MNMKRLFLTLCLMVMAGSTAWAEIASGKWNNGHWSISDDGELYVNCNSVSGDFKMPDYGEDKAPWYKYRDEIKAIRIGSYLRNIGRNAFRKLYKVESVTGGENVEAVAKHAFRGCGADYRPKWKSLPKIPVISFPKCSYVGEFAFYDTKVSIIDLPLVETWKADAVTNGYTKMIDLGSKVKMLRPCSMNGPEYVFIQNPTPPEWVRLYDTNEADDPPFYHPSPCYSYPFGGNWNRDVFVIVPKEYLQTYIDYYPSKHPEVGKGYMSAAFRQIGSDDKDEKKRNMGKLVAGAPIYEDEKLIGGWYVKEDTLNVFFNGNSMPNYGNGNAPWNSVLGTVTKMYVEYLGNDGETFFIDGTYTISYDTNPAFRGIKSVTFKGIDDLDIGAAAFANSTDLESVSFEHCGRKEEIARRTYYHYMPCSIDGYAFYGCKNFKSFSSLDDCGLVDIMSLGVSSFEGCESLISLNRNQVKISIRKVPERAFCGCKSFIWPVDEFQNLNRIDRQAFYCSSLKVKDRWLDWLEAHYIYLYAPEFIGEQAFANSNIETLQITNMENLEIESKAFANCPLKKICTSYGISNFKYSDDLFDGIDIESITLNVISKYFNQYMNHPLWGAMQVGDWQFPIQGDGWKINSSGIMEVSKMPTSAEKPWTIYKKYVTTIEVSPYLSEICEDAFAGMDYVEKVTIPRSIIKICDRAFKGCTNLSDIFIPDVVELGNNVFEDCSSLEAIDLGLGLKKVGDYIFKKCTSLQFIGNKDAIPAETTELTFAEIGSGAYEARSSGTRRASSDNGQANVTLSVPDEFVTNYIIDPNWGKFHIKFADNRGTWEHAGPFGDGTWILYDDSTMVVVADKGPDDFSWGKMRFTDEVAKKTKRVEFTGNVPSLGVVFDLFPNIESVSLCPSIKTLDGTFNYCEKLKEINLDDVETIGEGTFTHCALTDVDLSNVKSIGKDAFYGCEKLLFATLGSQCTVGKSVFSHCSSLVAVNLGGADLDNANGCFNSCKNLLSVVYNGKNLPNGIFANCTALEEVKLGSRVRSIQWTAFEGCTALSTIYSDSPMPPSLPTGKTQDVIGYEGSGDAQIPIFGPEYEVWAFNGLDKANIKLFVHPDCVPVYGRFDIWNEMDIQGNDEDVEPLLPTGGSLRGNGKDEDGENVMSGSTWYLDEEGKLTLDAKGNIAVRTSDNNYWWSEFDSYLPFIATVEVTDDVTGVPNNMFGWMDSERLTRGVTTVILGEGLRKAGYDAFHFSGIKDVYIYSENILDLHGNTFDQDAAVANNATLHVLKDPEDKYLEYYRLDNATKRFPNIVADLNPRHPKVQAVTFDIAEVTMHPGETLQLEPRFTPDNVEDKTLRYVDANKGHNVYVDETGLVTALSEGTAYIEAFSSYTVSREEVMALWGPTQEIYLKITVTAAEPGEEIFYDYKEGEGTEGLTITYHLLDDKARTCEVAGRYDEDDVTTLAVPENTTGAISIPKKAMDNKVIRIGANAFYELEGITEVRLPRSVTQIGTYAFARCYNLKDVYIPVGQPLQFTNSYGELMEESMGHNEAFNRVGEGDDGEGFATLHVPVGSRSVWNVYPWNEWFGAIVDDIEIPAPGDVNGDGEVNIADVTIIVNYIFGRVPEGFDEDDADVNGDNEVNALDVVMLVGIIAGQ
jgi:hypothetical protein